eukprot:CAMPEP_0180417628 /NCGR_PEP_ID=MMETSP1036_2-20121128/1132_1 /TAXON_ID=632150 /ORGANISM="Azadinium spinosum, Strain 3D9" /LENGTH=145 /DNA_ID=CAMNT_0022422665 /DNA_START=8 /DNA_END=445 /DNA_ORIENTATION=-
MSHGRSPYLGWKPVPLQPELLGGEARVESVVDDPLVESLYPLDLAMHMPPKGACGGRVPHRHKSNVHTNVLKLPLQYHVHTGYSLLNEGSDWAENLDIHVTEHKDLALLHRLQSLPDLVRLVEIGGDTTASPIPHHAQVLDIVLL